ncbi:hypothetical protein K4K59_010182 [Colletotrichum sp. SAR11_240]|nr:hypothetical protein K4K59_010182 [Colletotrichum sp. SAR11_240]
MQGTRAMDSIVDGFLQYEFREFYQFEKGLQNVTYFTEPDAEVDRNWHNILARDTTLITMKWNSTGLRPIGNLTSPHECVNWDRLMEWVVPNSFDALADGMLVHPTFGPVFRDRQLVEAS